ncbi:MAG: transcriptional repressor [Fidelibacterota bacterium]
MQLSIRWRYIPFRLRHSKHRERILKAVRSTDSHPTADWIFGKVRKRIPNISLGTVYRNLGQLVEYGLIQSRMIDGVVHYDGNLDDHQHFYCTCCHAIYDLDLPLEDPVSEMEARMKHDVHGYDLQLNGICRTCREMNKNERN